MKANHAMVMLSVMGAILSTGFHGSNASEIKISKTDLENACPRPSRMFRRGLSPADFFTARSAAGRPRRSKNLASCARKAKIQKRRSR